MKRLETHYRDAERDRPGFYHFAQNNPGGRFIIDADLTVNVVIEARDHRHANWLADEIGIDFRDGHGGDRWDPQFAGDGPRWRTLEEVEAHYAGVVWNGFFVKPGQPAVHIYTLDGRKVTLEIETQVERIEAALLAALPGVEPHEPGDVIQGVIAALREPHDRVVGVLWSLVEAGKVVVLPDRRLRGVGA